MKSSSEESLITDLKNYFQIVYKPNKTIKKINEGKGDIFNSFIIVLISGVIFLSGIFIVGDVLYSVFFEQYSSFILEQWTSSTLYGFNLSRFDYVLVFISGIIFIVKSWLLISLLNYGFLRLFKEKQELGTVMKKFAWVIYPYAWITFLMNMVCLIFKLVLPLFYHYIFYIGLVAIFLVLIPVILQIFNDEQEEEKKSSSYKVLFAYFLSLFIIVLLWTVNHYDIILLGLM